MLDGSVKRYLSYEELKNIDPEKALGIDLTKREYHLNGNFPKSMPKRCYKHLLLTENNLIKNPNLSQFSEFRKKATMRCLNGKKTN